MLFRGALPGIRDMEHRWVLRDRIVVEADGALSGDFSGYLRYGTQISVQRQDWDLIADYGTP